MVPHARVTGPQPPRPQPKATSNRRLLQNNMSPPRTMTCLVQPPAGQGSPVVSSEQPVPELRGPYDVLVRVSAVALNPTDHKMPTYHPVPGAVMGCDFTGTVVAAGSAVATNGGNDGDDSSGSLPGPGTRVCGPVHGSNPGALGVGAFAEYTVQDARLLVRVPASWSGDLEPAALGGVGWATVALAMEHSLRLKGTPSNPEPALPNGSKRPVLVYGGATATGTMACQLLSLSGYDPIATCSPSSAALVRKYGAAATVPYSSPKCAELIRGELKGRQLRAALDCIVSPESVQCCFSALGRAGARYAGLEHAPREWRTRKAVKVDMPMTYVVMGHEVQLEEPYHRDADPKMLELGARWCREVQALVDEGQLTCHPVREIPGGWQGIIDGLNMLKENRVRGQKLVCRLG
ncbi:hypothetical protein RB595_006936 [Gaeumannomyces hyphopodioides]